MAPLSLKVVCDDGAVTRTMMFKSTMRVEEAQAMVREKILTAHEGKDYGLFLTSADNEQSGVWLEGHRNLEYYMLRDGDQLYYLSRVRNLRVRMLDGSEKTMQVDESKTIEQLMVGICARIGITNYDEYGLCHIPLDEQEETKAAGNMGTLTLRRVTQQKERDAKLQQLSKKLKTDDNVEWLDQHKTLRELCVDAKQTLLLKRRLFFSDRNVDARDPVQLNLLYVQARDAILEGRHPVTEDKAGDCKVRWINIRDVNRRILKRSLTQSRPQNRMYKYEMEMSFMKPFYKDIGLPEGYEGEDMSLWEDCDDAPDPANDSDDMEKPLRSRKKGYKKRTKKTFNEEEDKCSTTMNDTQNSEFDSADPVDAFLLSIGATLKTFTPYHLNLAKSKIFAVVQEHDLQQIVQKSNEVKVAAPENIYMSENLSQL